MEEKFTVIKTIKLCDGFKMCITNPLTYIETEDWQEIREALHLDVKSTEWDTITREVFCLGRIEFTMRETHNGSVRKVIIEVIPCKD